MVNTNWNSTIVAYADYTYTQGLYEQQDPDQPEHNLRGKFCTDEAGRYAFYALRPTEYPVREKVYYTFNTSDFLVDPK